VPLTVEVAVAAFPRSTAQKWEALWVKRDEDRRSYTILTKSVGHFAETSDVDDACPHALMLVFSARALESIRNTKGKLMPCLEIHSRQDAVRHLGDTEVDGKPRGLHAPTVER
jgi:hypothetical protein